MREDDAGSRILVHDAVQHELNRCSGGIEWVVDEWAGDASRSRRPGQTGRWRGPCYLASFWLGVSEPVFRAWKAGNLGVASKRIARREIVVFTVEHAPPRSSGAVAGARC